MSSSDLPKLWTKSTKIGYIFRKQSKYFENQSFQKISFIKVDLLVKYSSQKKKSERFVKMPKNDFESTNFANFEEVVHNFGRSDDDMV